MRTKVVQTDLVLVLELLRRLLRHRTDPIQQSMYSSTHFNRFTYTTCPSGPSRARKGPTMCLKRPAPRVRGPGIISKELEAKRRSRWKSFGA